MAITSTLYYPSDYLPGPLKDSFGLTPVSPLKRTSMVTGRAETAACLYLDTNPNRYGMDF
ncbi:alkanesulfonate ABC transporter permease [Klebsiella michiganensis]|uniref:Alkanesulfonate ABC transporter permease n=1 Tax=Klebsiella michiganensis TaxID=1134687 RepID=A0A7H4LWG3_9ENTR|nr:alkanesulfonate ABC transporter permease [Klebsiella michiganensis]